MRKVAIGLFLLAIFVSGCGAKRNFSAIPPRGAKVVNLPKWYVGDTWTIDRDGKKSISTIIKSSKIGYIVQRKKDKKQFFYDRNLRYLGRGSKGRLKYKAPFQVYHFPIWAGKAWKLTQGRVSSSGAIRNYASVFYVESVEMISVPAGKFLAYKIVEERTSLESGSWAEYVRYYSPKVKRFIRRSGSRSSSSSYELISYKVK